MKAKKEIVKPMSETAGAVITISYAGSETRIDVSQEAVDTFNRLFDHQKTEGQFPERMAKLYQDTLRGLMRDPNFAPAQMKEMLLRLRDLDEQLAKLQESAAKSGFNIAERGPKG